MWQILISLVTVIVSLGAISRIVLTAYAHPVKSPTTNTFTHCGYEHPVAIINISLGECVSTHWLEDLAELWKPGV